MSFSGSQIPFAPNGLSHYLVANVAPPTPVQILVGQGQTAFGQYRIINNSARTVFLGVGGTAAQATARAAAIVAGTPQDTIVLVPGAVEILRLLPDGFFTAASPAGAADVYITPGQGL